MKTTKPSCLRWASQFSVLFILLFAAFSTKAATYYWTNLAGGNWGAASCWSPNQVPGAGDNAFIISNGVYTVGVSDTSGVAINNLTMGGTSGTQTLGIAGVLTINGAFVGNAQASVNNTAPANNGGGGEIEGTGTMTLAGPMYWYPVTSVPGGEPSGNYPITLSLVQTANATIEGNGNGQAGFGGGVWINTGTMTVFGVPWQVASGSVMSNAPGATLIFTNMYALITNGFSGGGSFCNGGQVYAEDPDGQETISTFLNNTGTITITNGANMLLAGGCTNLGSVVIEANSALETTNGGVNEFSVGSTVSGPGTFEMLGTNGDLNGTVSCNLFLEEASGVTITGAMNATSNVFNGTATLTNGATLNNALVITRNVNFAGTGAIQPSSLAMIAGVLSGTDLVDAGTMTWSGGTISGLVECDGGDINSQNSCILSGGELINTGVLTVQSTEFLPNISVFQTDNGAIVSNALGASFNFIGGTTGTVTSGGSTLYNAGTLTATNNSAVAATFTVGSLVNSGTVTIYTNTSVILENGGTNQSQIDAGPLCPVSLTSGSFDYFIGSTLFAPDGFTFNIGSGSAAFAGTMDVGGAADFESGTATYSGNSTFTNGISVSGGTVDFGGDATLNTVTIIGGTVNATNSPAVITASTVSQSSGTLNVSIAGAFSASAYQFSGGTESGTQAFQVEGPFTWTGGSLNGVLACDGGSINVNNGSAIGADGELINTGVLTWTPNTGPRTGGNPGTGPGTIISNTASGTINVVLNGGGNNIDSYVYGYTTAFYNAGQINISGTGQANDITDPFYNTGTVAISSGTLGITSGGTNSGTITVASGATFNPIAGTFASTSGSLISGAGNLLVSGGTANFGGPFNLSGSWTFSGGTANFTGSSAVTSAAITNGNGNALNLSGTGPWQTAMLVLSGSTLGGTTPLLDSGPLYWTGGNITGTLTFSGGSINVTSSSGVEYGGQLINNGLLTWTANGGPRTGGSPGGTVISNATSGTINFAMSGGYDMDYYVYGYSTAFYNAGQINISGAGQTGGITDPFFNTGTLTISGGTFALSGGGTNYSTINVASGATFNPAGGTFTCTTGSTLSGAGGLEVSGGTADFAGPLNLSGAWTFNGGTANLTGTSAVIPPAITNNANGTVNFTGAGPWQTGEVTIAGGATFEGTAPLQDSGLLSWTGGNITGILIFSGGSINVNNGSAIEYGGQLINTGLLTWTANSGPRTGGSPGGTVISNATSGTINFAMSGGYDMDYYVYGYSTAFYNAGQINISGAGQTGGITDPFFNTGTLTISGGAFALSGGGTNYSTINVASGATFNPAGGTFTCATGSTLSGAGSLEVSSGTANFAGPLNLSGAWTFNGGTANLTGTSAVTSLAITNNGGGTVNFTGAGPWQTGQVTLAGSATLEGTAPVQDSGLLSWTSGTLSGIVDCDGGSMSGGLSLSGAIANSGTLTWSGSLNFFGGHLTNLLSGTLNAAAGVAANPENGSPNIDNDGQFNTTGPGASTFNLPFNNYGSVTVSNNGTLNLGGGGNEPGSFSVTSGSDLNFTGGTFTLGGNCLVGGPGNCTVGGATVNATNACAITNGLILSSGTLNANGSSAALTPTSLTINGGTEAGNQPIQILNTGSFTWNSGSVDGTVSFNGGSISGGLSLNGTLVNSGLLGWSGNLNFYGGHLTNLGSGTVNLAAGVSANAENGTPNIDNDGQFNSTGPGSSTLNLLFNNYGTVTISNSGTLNLGGGGTEPGTFSVTSGADLGLNNGTFTLGGNCLVGGPGNCTVGGGTVNATNACAMTNGLILSGGTFNVNGSSAALTPASLTINGGTEAGNQPIQVSSSGGFNWSSGSIYGTVSFNGGSFSSGLSLNGTLVNSGLLAWSGNLNFYGGHVTNAGSGTINLAANVSANAENGTPNLENDGQLNMAGPGAASLNLPFNNYGTITVSNSGTLNLGEGGSVPGSFFVTSGADLDFNGGTFTLGGNCLVGGAGNCTVGGGTVNATNACAITNGLVLSGGTFNVNGTSAALTPSSLTISAGTEAGTQPIQVSSSGGFSWTGGNIYGMVSLDGGSIAGGLNLYGNLVNSGPLTWSGTLYFYGGHMTNLGSGTVNLGAGTYTAVITGTPDLDNDGQINATGPGTATMGLPFNNSGTVTVSNNGIFNLTDVGSENGSFTVSSGATLGVGGGTINFNSSSTISGAGNFAVTGGTANLGGTNNLTGTNTYSGGTANVTGAFDIAGPLVVSGGALNLNGNGLITPSTLTVTGGTLQGAQTTQVATSGGFTWSGGSVADTVLLNGGSVAGAQNLYGILVNSGTLGVSNSLYLYGGSITNLPAGTLNLAPGIFFDNLGGSPAIENGGQLNITGPGTTSFGVPFTNFGTVNIPSGTLALNSGYSLTNGAVNFGIASTSSYGALSISGSARLAGTLDVTFNGYTPIVFDTFNLISYNSESGLFTGLNLPSAVSWNANYGATHFSIEVTSLTAPNNLTLVPARPAFTPTGFNLLVSGPIGSNYTIQVSTNLNLTTWATLTNFVGASTLTPILDTAATNSNFYSGRFYRGIMH